MSVSIFNVWHRSGSFRQVSLWWVAFRTPREWATRASTPGSAHAQEPMIRKQNNNNNNNNKIHISDDIRMHSIFDTWTFVQTSQIVKVVLAFWTKRKMKQKNNLKSITKNKNTKQNTKKHARKQLWVCFYICACVLEACHTYNGKLLIVKVKVKVKFKSRKTVDCEN